MTSPLWKHYVFRRGLEVQALWDRIYQERHERGRPVRLLYIAGGGFDVRAQIVMNQYVTSLKDSGCQIESATLVLVDVGGYELSEELIALTKENARCLSEAFASIGNTVRMPGDHVGGDDDEEVSAN